MKILLVDDEAQLSEPLRQVLVKEGYSVDVAVDGSQGLRLAQAHGYDLLILDWMLPQCSGVEICRQLRSLGQTTPVLLLTAKDTVDDRVVGLDAGADDYLIKPFELRELLARVRALLRRSPRVEPTTSERLTVSGLELDSDNQLVYRQGKAIKLSDKERQLLRLFMSHPEQLLTREQLYQHLWHQQEQPNSNVLAALIRLLRRKIEVKGEPPLIHTIYGKGYRFSSHLFGPETP